MVGKNQNRPPSGRVSDRPSSTPSIIKCSASLDDYDDDVSVHIRRRSMIPKMGGPRAILMKPRPALSVVNGAGHDPGSDGNSTSIEFTMKKFEELLNEKSKVVKNRLNYKEKCDEMQGYIKRLKPYFRWFQEKLSIEESDRMALMDAFTKEKEARIAAEKLQISHAEELHNSRREISIANQTILSVNDMNKQLLSDIAVKDEDLNRSGKEKAVLVDSLATLRVNYALLQASHDNAMKQKEASDNDLGWTRNELQQVRGVRDCQNLKIKTLKTKKDKYKEDSAKHVSNLDGMTLKAKELEITCASQSEQIKILKTEVDKYKEDSTKLVSSLDGMTLKLEELEITCASKSEQIGILQRQLDQTERQLDQTKRQLDQVHSKLQLADLSANSVRTKNEDQEKVICDLQLKLVEVEKQRKELHNTVMELKGNIRVFCRVRPLLPEEGNLREAQVISYPVGAESLGRGIQVTHNGKRDSFTFDKVFTPDGSQEDVFVEIEQLVQSALDGYRVCIFAYGQTGSGKTYTMMGTLGKSDQKGLIPRSLEQIFQKCQEAYDWKYEMNVYVLEIYNETIRDLLSSNGSSSSMCSEMGITENGKQPYTIKQDQNGNTWVPGLTVKHVDSIEQVYELLHQAEKNRSVGKTQMNEESSRSHFVFKLQISGHNLKTGQQVEGILNLIDLAGSERLSKSGSTGDRLKETQAINTSLSALTDVIYALTNKQEHVPFRNSKLTYLLKPCLEGDSKVLMFVNISPDPSSASESLNSVKFAARVNACEIGIPRRQTAFRSSSSSCRLSNG